MLKHQPRKKKLSSVLDIGATTRQNDELSQLITFAERINGLDEMFQAALPEALQPFFKANTLQNGLLTVTCSSAAQATRFRLQQKMVIAALNSQGLRSVKTIKIKIRPVIKQTEPKPIERTLSQDNARILESEASQTEDQALKSVLLKLAARGENTLDN